MNAIKIQDFYANIYGVTQTNNMVVAYLIDDLVRNVLGHIKDAKYNADFIEKLTRLLEYTYRELGYKATYRAYSQVYICIINFRLFEPPPSLYKIRKMFNTLNWAMLSNSEQIDYNLGIYRLQPFMAHINGVQFTHQLTYEICTKLQNIGISKTVISNSTIYELSNLVHTIYLEKGLIVMDELMYGIDDSIIYAKETNTILEFNVPLDCEEYEWEIERINSKIERESKNDTTNNW